MIRNYLLIFASLFLTIGCAHKQAKEDTITPISQLYRDGMDAIEKRKYQKAVESFELIYFQHPRNSATPYAQIMEGYSLFLDKKYDDAIDAFEHFAKYHPTHSDIAYVKYMIALCNYNQISDIERDQAKTIISKAILNDIILNHPNTKYATDAQIKITIIEDLLAAKEVEIGREYIRVKNTIAAINRFKTVIEVYANSNHTKEALYRLVEGYLILGIKDEATKYSNILSQKYAKSYWDESAKKLIAFSSQPKLKSETAKLENNNKSVSNILATTNNTPDETNPSNITNNNNLTTQPTHSNQNSNKQNESQSLIKQQ